MSLETLGQKPIMAACAIGNPESFVRTLKDLGAFPSLVVTNRDHGTLPLDTIPTDAMLIVTEKDAARIEKAPGHVWALEIELRDY